MLNNPPQQPAQAFDLVGGFEHDLVRAASVDSLTTQALH
jgi:hypothetical protein